MRNYVPKESVYRMDKNRYGELNHFCMQYREKRKRLLAISRRIEQGFEQDSAVLEALLRDCRDMEAAAVQATPDECMAGHILRYVSAKDKPYLDTIPCGRRQFYEMRRKFFQALDKRRSDRGWAEYA